MSARRGLLLGALGIALIGAVLGSSPAMAASGTASTDDGGKAKIVRTAGGCRVGTEQRLVEEYLQAHPEFGPVSVDGRQSSADCAAIKKFQTRYGLIPVDGIPGPDTAEVVNRLKSANLAGCVADGDGQLSVCVDQASQTAWAVENGKVVYGPVPVRTGMKWYETTQGHWKINIKKATDAFSDKYEVIMPYYENFHNGMALHQTTSYLYKKPVTGSHGCVNMLAQDAKWMFEHTSDKLATAGDQTTLHVFGTRPGTRAKTKENEKQLDEEAMAEYKKRGLEY